MKTLKVIIKFNGTTKILYFEDSTEVERLQTYITSRIENNPNGWLYIQYYEDYVAVNLKVVQSIDFEYGEV